MKHEIKNVYKHLKDLKLKLWKYYRKNQAKLYWIYVFYK